MTLARELKKRGVAAVAILEKNSATGAEASHAAAGLLSPQAEANENDDFLQFCLASGRLYPEFARQLYDETGIDVEFDSNGTIYLSFSEEDSQALHKRFEWQRNAGLSVERLSAVDTHKMEPFVSPEIRESLFFPNDRQVENRKLLLALERSAEFNGVSIVKNANVLSLPAAGGRVTAIETDTEKFSAGTVVLATGAWTSLIKMGRAELPALKVAPRRGQMIGFRTAKRLFTRVVYSRRGYLVPRNDGRILAGATVEDAGFEKKVTRAGVDFVWNNSVEIAPSLERLDIQDKWSGLRPFAADALPVLGKVPGAENLFVATAHFRNGILLAPKTAEVMAENILSGQESLFIQTFNAARMAKTA